MPRPGSLPWKLSFSYSRALQGPALAAWGGQAANGRGWATFYTKVPNLEAALAQAQKLGSSVRVPITELPDTRIAVVTDPEGNAVGLCADKA